MVDDFEILNGGIHAPIVTQPELRDDVDVDGFAKLDCLSGSSESFCYVLGYGMLEHPVDGPLRLARAVHAVGVGITPGECRRRHAAVIVRVEATCPVPAGQVDCLHMI